MMGSHPARGDWYRTGIIRAALFVSLIVSIVSSTLPAYARDSAVILPSCHAFARAAKRLPRTLGLYMWPDKLSFLNSRFPRWKSVNAELYEDKLQRVFDNDNPLLANPSINYHRMVGKRFVVKSHISDQLEHGWIKTYTATFSLSGPQTRVEMLRIDTLYDHVGTLLRDHGRRSKAQFQRSYVVLRSESNPLYDGHAIDPTGAAQNTSLSVLLFGNYAYWIDASNGDIFLIKGRKPFVANTVCERTNAES